MKIRTNYLDAPAFGTAGNSDTGKIYAQQMLVK